MFDYKTDSAKCHLMCMPLAIGEPSSGVSQTYVMELTSDADYNMVREILMRFQPLATRKITTQRRGSGPPHVLQRNDHLILR